MSFYSGLVHTRCLSVLTTLWNSCGPYRLSWFFGHERYLQEKMIQKNVGHGAKEKNKSLMIELEKRGQPG